MTRHEAANQFRKFLDGYVAAAYARPGQTARQRIWAVTVRGQHARCKFSVKGTDTVKGVLRLRENRNSYTVWIESSTS